MFMIKNRMVALMAFIGLVFIWVVDASVQEDAIRITNLSDGRSIKQPRHPKLDGQLSNLILEALYGHLQIPDPNLGKKISYYKGKDMPVVIEIRLLKPIGTAHLGTMIVRRAIEDVGGEIEAEAENLISARLSPKAILTLVNNDFVQTIRLPLRPEIDTYISEGVAAIGANLWNALEPYRRLPRTIKIGILDAGFKGYAGLLSSELPSNVNVRSFRPDGDISANEVHGTACAEIIYDMAPGAELFLVNATNEVTTRLAVDYLINQGVDIISYSMGWKNAGAGDGTGPNCEIVKRATDRGIVWINSAGNETGKHWENVFTDSDNDKYLNFSGVDEILDFWVPSYTPVSVALNWDDWGIWNGLSYGGSRQDYDLDLYYWTGSKWIWVESSVREQTGQQWPVENIGGWYANFPTYWGVSIYRYSTTRNCKLELFVDGNSNNIQYNVPEGSLLTPSDASSALAIGAVSWLSDSYHSYSSRGPSHDGRIKPDFCAPSGVSGASYGIENFYGTSASAPHVAGALGAVMLKLGCDAHQAINLIRARIIDLGAAGKDNFYGEGRINLKK